MQLPHCPGLNPRVHERGQQRCQSRNPESHHLSWHLGNRECRAICPPYVTLRPLPTPRLPWAIQKAGLCPPGCMESRQLPRRGRSCRLKHTSNCTACLHWVRRCGTAAKLQVVLIARRIDWRPKLKEISRPLGKMKRRRTSSSRFEVGQRRTYP